MKDLKCCFGFLFEKYEKIRKLEVLIGAQIVVTSAVVDLWVRRTMYPSTYRCQNDHWRKISPSKNCSVLKKIQFFVKVAGPEGPGSVVISGIKRQHRGHFRVWKSAVPTILHENQNECRKGKEGSDAYELKSAWHRTIFKFEMSDYKFDQICMYVKSLYAILRVFACFRTARNLRRAHLRPRALHR